MEKQVKQSIILGITSSIIAQMLIFIVTEALKSFFGVPFDWLQFFLIQFPLWLVLLLLSIIPLTFAFLLRSRRRSNILDFDYGRHIALLCQTARSTDHLRGKYEEWKRRSHWVVLGGYNFDDYVKRLEKQGYLKYRNGKWKVTDKALDYIDKYHGG